MSQKLFIPALGTLFFLAEEWSFKLYFNTRNKSMLEVFGGWKVLSEKPDFLEFEPALTKEVLATAYPSFKATNSHDNPFIRVTLPKGTQLKIDRIYIRRGSEAFDSVTFRTTKICPDRRFASKRFWAKLREVNEIIADVVG